ncbi:uncharacterized protein [Misgurnus anguillicaudatus]|uniref:uncharacterized protein n=1 Tax=Misgurnus anguillicaudatus TaxID=75329 RepID=UPI003CCF1066
MLDQPEGEGIFNRLFNAAARARQELAARNDDSTLLSTTRRLFRRRVHRVRGGSGGRRENPIWQTRLFLLPGPDNGFLPPTTELEELAKHGLGKPVHESTEAGRTNSKIGLNWSLAELNNFVCQSYPRISLNLVGFELARTGKGRKIQKLQVSSVKELKAVVGKSRLYIVPRATVLQVTSPPSAMSQNSLAAPAVDQTSQVVSDQVASTSSAVSMNSVPPLSLAPVQDETVAESTQAQSVVANQALQEWRAIRAQQDQEYNRSLLVDQEKERKKLAYQACEERHQKAIQGRRQRMSACEEPSEGVLIKFKYPNGHINMRKFILSEPIQILFAFVGQDDIASEIFVVQEAASSTSVKSSSSGSIMNHGIKASTTLYVLWFSNMDVQNILSDQQNDGAYALHHTSHGQSSLPEPSTQPSLPEPSTRSLLPEPSTRSLLPEPSTRSLLPEPSTRSLLPEPSTRSLLPEPSTRSLLPEPSTRSLLLEASTRSLVPVPSTQPSLSLRSFQPPLPEPSTRSLPEPSNQTSLSLLSFQPPLPEPSTHLLLPEPSNQPPLTLFSQPEEILTLYDEPALSPSAQEPIILDEQEMVSGIDLQTILKKMVSKVDRSFCPTSNQINVCRDNVLLCSLRAFKRKFFNPEAKLDVVFVDEDDNGEGAVDEGGPTREYLRLLMRAVHQSIIFEGHEKDRQLSLDTRALQTKLYMWVAKMIAVCVVHGGIGPHFFSERLFHQICGIPTHPATVDEVGDHTFREQLIKIKETTTVREANSAIAEAADSLSIIGALRHVSSLKEKDSLVQSAADFFVNGRLATALDQFVEGLKTLGLLEELRKNPVVFYNMFVSEEIPLQAKDLCTLFEVDFSVQGSNRRDRDNMTICFWRDWLIDIEEGECSPVTLEKVLEFTSGASTVPVLGFPHRPQIQFLHEANRIFPEANTCILVLRLPLHSSYEAFKQYMMEGILQAPTFGLA